MVSTSQADSQDIFQGGFDTPQQTFETNVPVPSFSEPSQNVATIPVNEPDVLQNISQPTPSTLEPTIHDPLTQTLSPLENIPSSQADILQNSPEISAPLSELHPSSVDPLATEMSTKENESMISDIPQSIPEPNIPVSPAPEVDVLAESSVASSSEASQDILQDFSEASQTIIEQNPPKLANSSAFADIAKVVKDFLDKQDSLGAQKTLTLGAMKLGSSDIHYDNTEEDMVIRFRIDGLLVDIFHMEKKQYKFLLERLKHSSNLKLNITHIPQDGKYALDL